MNRENIKKQLMSSLSTFEKRHPEWTGIDIEMYDQNGDIYIEAEGADEDDITKMLLDFAPILKEKNMMVHEYSSPTLVTQYYYEYEDGMEEMADDIEVALGDAVSNLKVSYEDGVPVVNLIWIGNKGQEERENLGEKLKNVINSYTAMDESELLNTIDFMDFEDIINNIEKEESKR